MAKNKSSSVIQSIIEPLDLIIFKLKMVYCQLK